MKVTKKLVMFLLVLGTIFLVTQGAWAAEVLYAPFEDYYLVGSTVSPHTTVYVADSSQQCVLTPWACPFLPNNNPQPPVLWVLGKVGMAFEFFGNQYITVDNSAQLNLETYDFAITFWVKTNSAKAYNNIIDKRPAPIPAPGVVGYAVCIYNGYPLLHIKSTASTWRNYFGNASSPKVNDGNWHYVAIYVERRNAVGGKIYIDGVCAHTFNPTEHTGNISNKEPLFIGKHATWTNSYFEGTLDEVRIFRAQ
ncbi:MAG: LamG domain-containing protein [Candidatus Aminicenantes bacterium]|nr:LamG domain-containing protein [Candidatus Aminicenantes bacterium]